MTDSLTVRHFLFKYYESKKEPAPWKNSTGLETKVQRSMITSKMEPFTVIS